ncbi:MAG: hypothetical protein KAS32_12585 [Candidatus Peribacteraceae bacterium]|nr:hypothetical protein [Candidatus Peribacteraceae bacterium]
MSVSKIFTITFVLCALSAAVVFSSDSMSTVVNRLMMKGYTTEQIVKMKAYPKWPTHDESTGLLKDGPQRHVSTDLRLAVIFHVRTFEKGQRVEREVLYDDSKNQKVSDK